MPVEQGEGAAAQSRGRKLRALRLPTVHMTARSASVPGGSGTMGVPWRCGGLPKLPIPGVKAPSATQLATTRALGGAID
eukprot:scaffold191276_cov31-Tisochrysis_lutea.AAC.4